MFEDNSPKSSAGHKLGQIIGDWFEEYFVLPILEEVAQRLGLFLDHRFKKRSCRSDRIIWVDSEGNNVSYDFVLELNGDDKRKGIPVAFFESCWRRGSRHSKDKARDDSGKLVPMRFTYPTARVLGMIVGGDFTDPAKELVKSRGIDIFYVNKEKIFSAWLQHGLTIDYPDKSTEESKLIVLDKVEKKISDDSSLFIKIGETLRKLVKESELKAYIQRLLGIIGSTPQEYSVTVQKKSLPILFENHKQVDEFLEEEEPQIVNFHSSQYYSYRVTFSNADVFLRDDLTWEELREKHQELKALILKMEDIYWL